MMILRRTIHSTVAIYAKKARGIASNSPSKTLGQIQKALQVIENTVKDTYDVPKSKILGIATTQRPHFPGFYKSITVKDPNIVAAIKENLLNQKNSIGVFYSKSNESTDEIISSPEVVHHVGVLAQIFNMLPGPSGSFNLFLFPHRRVSIESLEAKRLNVADEQDVNNENALSYVTLSAFKDEPYNIEKVRALSKEVVDTLNELSELNPLIKDQLSDFLRTIGGPVELDKNPQKLADFVAAISDGDSEQLLEILQSPSVEERLEMGLSLLKKEIWNAQLQSEINKEVEKKLSDKDREAYLLDRLKRIQQELGIESVSREKTMEKFRKRVSEMNMPEYAQKVFKEEMAKLSSMRPAAQEYNLTVNYLDWLTQVPWGKLSKENLDVFEAEKILNEDHFGLKDVKERILEFIAVGKLHGTVEGKIICLVGPPGVGKTSIGKSVARSLNRKFYRFSVGGLYDVAEIKGHRRTYVGALPGKIIHALKNTQTENPMIMLDEGRGGYSGDPFSALLEVLDPEQNNSFMDHYLDISVNLSKVLFVCTANTLDTIPGPLLDRMEIINLSGYVAEEKLSIAKQYLIPQVLKDSGVTENDVSISDDAILVLIERYCRENGVRNLKKQIEKIYRKVALKLVETEQESPLPISSSNLKDFIGSPVYSDNNLYSELPPGVSIGLAYNQISGSSLFIEVVLESPIKEKSTPYFKQTGQMGDVMKESASIAYSFAKHFIENLSNIPKEKKKFFNFAKLHMHIPEGAIPKDGPSAGITMCSSLLSIALNTPLPRDLAMTGEITLTGKVLKIGGLKEKIMAAKRMGIKRVVMPHTNQADFDDLDSSVKSGIEAIYAKSYEDVFKAAFPSLSQ